MIVEDQTSITLHTFKCMGEYFRQTKSNRLWWAGNVARNARDDKDINVARNARDEKDINVARNVGDEKDINIFCS
jgi:hypothetical protein